MEVGKREFARNPLKYLKDALRDDLIICHRGNPELVIKKIHKAEASAIFAKYSSPNINKIVDGIINE